MLPADNYRRKLMLLPNNYTYLLNLTNYGYQPQFVRNTLQLSQGHRLDSLNSLPNYAEIAMLAGLPATDWSWTPLVADFDLDGYRDVIITNGFPRDITDHDFGDYNAASSRFFPIDKILPKIPSVKLRNEAFRARPLESGMPTFDRVSEEWGIDVTSFSNGAAYADLDNDGDLDYIVNNIDDLVHVYQNNEYSNGQVAGKNSIVIEARSGLASEQFFGSEVIVVAGDQRQTAYWHPHRGYLSSHGNSLHFGLGQADQIDSVLVRWSGQETWEYFGPVSSRERLAIQPGQGKRIVRGASGKMSQRLLVEVNSPDYTHEERDFIDFNVQPLLLRKLSQQGPGLAVTDYNQDGLEDIYVSGSFEREGAFFMGTDAGLRFVGNSPFLEGYSAVPEELGSLFFDADGDGDEDLYIVVGSYEYPIDNHDYRDRFYRNDDGRFTLQSSALIDLPEFSGSCVRAADYDLDGDLDLFVCARVEPHQYPKPVASYLLRNESDATTIKFVVDQR
ncbi:MAG: FG-GAP-like repeat-containing protein, partial [Bacteroidota bacterium]